MSEPSDMIVPVAPMRSPDTIAATIKAGLLNNSRIILSAKSRMSSDKILRGIALVQATMPMNTSVEVEGDQVKVVITKGG